MAVQNATILPVNSPRTAATEMPRIYVQPWARYAVIIASVLRIAALRPTQQASCQNQT